jgi:hypothetical protein
MDGHLPHAHYTLYDGFPQALTFALVLQLDDSLRESQFRRCGVVSAELVLSRWKGLDRFRFERPVRLTCERSELPFLLLIIEKVINYLLKLHPHFCARLAA